MRSKESDEIQVGLDNLVLQFRIGPRREICQEEALSPTLDSRREELTHSILQNGIQVGKKNYGEGMIPSEAAQKLQYPLNRHSPLKGLEGGSLDGGPIGQRVAEGDPEFQDVRTGSGQDPH